jgi:hypothetical protein
LLFGSMVIVLLKKLFQNGRGVVAAPCRAGALSSSLRLATPILKQHLNHGSEGARWRSPA